MEVARPRESEERALRGQQEYDALMSSAPEKTLAASASSHPRSELPPRRVTLSRRKTD